MFLASLVGDIVRGMCYLHESVFKSHGNLKSSNCLIDSRWVLKISDFGLKHFKEHEETALIIQQVGLLSSVHICVLLWLCASGRSWVVSISTRPRSVWGTRPTCRTRATSTPLPSSSTRCTAEPDHLETQNCLTWRYWGSWSLRTRNSTSDLSLIYWRTAWTLSRRQ